MNKISNTARIGQDGFRYDRVNGVLIEIPHDFDVKLGDDLRIGEFVTIDKGRWRNTEIGNNTKIDHYAHIAHNAIIGESCLIHVFVNICGSVEIGNRCEIFPHCNIQPHVKICDDVIIGDGSIVRHDITEKGTYVYAGNGRMRKIK